MWLTKEELNKTRLSEESISHNFAKIIKNKPSNVFVEPEIIEHNGILIVKGNYLKMLFSGVEDVYTSFIRVGKKVTDGDGGLTGIGLNIRQYAKLLKNKKYERFESSILIPYIEDDLSTAIEHFLEVYPKSIIDSFDQKVFLKYEKIEQNETKKINMPILSTPDSLKDLHFEKTYILLHMMVLRK